ncbi:hypothetical protein PGUG_05081 [Meyerozyma guilliermondii ATCC 6260]|uniref:Uncharacterized protein n=1 Tax=Meyerozyma guilliermondii (strain ATCC 6260 / CBS 566 / DSM 6381 / JCM 1539 / NBRC 10279 / NRRL Y-324) TaxID=294746 RepID=A5DP80_PICGU|nr:uncharacterized protein PGUG_05081 [Meyerozyma guilliermondii ATCC 6260]EDK40983.2 hypothetical protein PGUG_05081 [Meyerozyma guilliermondii ATCC 6260]
MISRLPVEIQVRLLKMEPSSSLKMTNSYFYILYNDLYYDKIIESFGKSIVPVLIKILPWLKTYIKTLEVFRSKSRQIISNRLDLTDTGVDYLGISWENPLHCQFIKDSWKYVYSVLKNKRLFAEYSDYKIDRPTNYVYHHFVEVNRTYLLSYTKTVWLAAGDYNLNIGLVIKHGNGLGTTKFEIEYESEDGKTVAQTFYPPSNINDILPKKQFCFLKIGEFSIPQKKKPSENKLFKVKFTMEEIGLYLKSGFRIFFIDLSQPSMLFNDYDLLYYSLMETDYKYFINIPMKNLYRALNYVQNGGNEMAPLCPSGSVEYGSGEPMDIWSEYNQEYLNTHNAKCGHCTDEEVVPTRTKSIMAFENDTRWLQCCEDRLMQYGNFFFNNNLKRRYFKFNTVYQRRQFINRYGDFELDWEENANGTHKDGTHQEHKNIQPYSYDSEGIKWKIPILGEL